MTSKRRYGFFPYLLSVLFLCLLALLLSACAKKEEDWEKTLHDAGKTVHIIYDGNGGLFDKYAQINVYVAPGDPIPEVEETPRLTIPLRNGYYIEGWYFASYDETGMLVLGDTKVDFAGYAVEGDVVLAPKWEPVYEVRFYAGNGQTVELTYSFTPESSYEMPITAPTKEGYTFLKEYAFSEQDTGGAAAVVQFPLSYETVRSCDADGDRVVSLYPQFIENINGKPWVIVEKKADMSRGTNYYLKADIDFTGETASVWAYRFRGQDGVIWGNGHKITGLNLSVQATRGESSYGLFPAGSVAQIEDLIFENCSYTVVFPVASVSTPAFRAAFLSGSTEVLRLNGVEFVECTLNIRILEGIGPEWGVLSTGENTVFWDGTPVADCKAEVPGIAVTVENENA